MKADQYLIPGRLEDVLFLIQFLSLEQYGLERGTEVNGVRRRSGESWEAVAREHPEFFRVLETGTATLALRYYLRPGQGGANPDPLKMENVKILMETAISLHERQAKRADVWKTRGTFIAALVAAVAGIKQLFFQ